MSFRVGSAVVSIYKTNKYKLLFIPYVVQEIIDKYLVDLEDYNLQAEYCCDLKLLPIKHCDDYLESQKLKKSFVYKIGEIILEAQKSRFKLGYLALLLKLVKNSINNIDRRLHI
ncbi:hypothetical protein NNQ38_001753 [Campylobacter jejuni]|uniref:hypothetical protein n=1 Tax=Campylobacter jejuni TaxID=197 RepID=UPI0004590297|nr:hypothetical protein [Campylobacter jejuni]KDA36063.1 hypothetical protein N218_10785 [Campylobacter jejuni K5]EHY7172331.1 hypothetical protein [Campylobacter jejuni]EJM0340000.1 hypothetical protein [Campylobacter jejuni]EKQ4950475.1 hypothetical protein [Campylobacter jejuni]ELO5860674.1 hypothetical protein [Campylobacter jejuni]